MKRMIHRLSALLLVFTVAILLAFPASAAGQSYTYTVRFHAGNQGSFNGESEIVYSGLNYGDRVSFSAGSVTLKENSKYYVSGIRESGRDNNTIGASSFVVTGDADYVVAYAMLGNSVAYTVRFVDANGNELAPAESYYGNVGDKPVLAYAYVDGYQPNAYNLTKTLSENAADNIFTFVYSPLPAESSTVVVVPSNPGGTDDTAQNETPDGNTGDTDSETPVPGETGTDDADHPDDQTETETPDAAEDQTPEEIVDLDDAEAPLVDDITSGNKGTDLLESSNGILIGSVALAVIGLACVLAAVVVKRKR